MATIRIPKVLQAHTGGRPEVEAAGSNVGEVLRALTAAHFDAERTLQRAEAGLNRYVNVYLDDEDVRGAERSNPGGGGVPGSVSAPCASPAGSPRQAPRSCRAQAPPARARRAGCAP